MNKTKTLIITTLILFSSTLALAESSADSTSAAAAGADATVTYTDNSTSTQELKVENDYTNASAQELKMENDYSQTFEASKPMRGFANAGGVAFPMIPSFFGPDTPGHSFQKMELILPLKNQWERWELTKGLSETNMMYRCRFFMKTRKTLLKELSGKKKDEFYGPLKESLEEKPEDSIIFITAPPAQAFRMIGHITIWATDEYTTSFELMEQAGLLGMEIPSATALLITGQGSTKQLQTKGWGIGVNHTTATVSDSQNSGTVNSGGTGYSSGKAGNVEYPWLQLAIIE